MKPLFVQIKCELGQANAVAERIFEEIAEISELYSTSGAFDLLAKFYLAEAQGISDFVTLKLQRVRGIRDTATIVAFRMETKAPGDLMAETVSAVPPEAV